MAFVFSSILLPALEFFVSINRLPEQTTGRELGLDLKHTACNSGNSSSVSHGGRGIDHA